VCGRWPRHALPLEPGENADAAQADLVVVATPWESAAPTAQLYADALAGKVVVSMANALVRVGREFQALVLPRGSVAAHVQAVLPRSSVVAAFHHLPARELADLDEPVRSDVLICSDEPSATRAVADVVDKIPGCRSLDAGSLSNATAIETLTAVLLQLNVRYKTRVAPTFTGIDR